MSKRHKIILITRNLPPLVGGMERLNYNLAKYLASKHALHCVAPENSRPFFKFSESFIGVPLNPLSRFLTFTTFKALRTALHVQPSYIIAGSGLTAVPAFIASKLTGAKLVVYLHGLDIATPNKIYRLLWIPTIVHANIIIANSESTRSEAIARGANPNKISIIHPGVKIPEEASKDESKQFIRKHGLEGKNLLLSVGRITERKGLYEFVENCLPGIVESLPNTVLIVIGAPPKSSISAKPQTVADILAVAAEKGVSENINFLGEITDFDELSGAYWSCHAHVFPVKAIAGDPEGFGMVAIEAAAHGLPTIAFNTGGISNAVDNGRSGYLVQPEDYTAFARKVIETVSAKEQFVSPCVDFAKNFSWSQFNSKIERVLTNASD